VTVRVDLILAAILTTSVGAQVPVPPPGALAGIVRDAAGNPLPGVTVSLVGETPSTRTDSAGVFLLRDVPAGGHTALFRRIGLQSVERRWTARSSVTVEIEVTMAPIARRLNRVVVEAPSDSRRRGTSSIGGTVADSAGHPINGADVRVLGTGLSTVTDESGQFEFRSLAAGSYIVRVRRQGLRASNAVMQIVDDDHRGISIRMFGLPRGASHDDAAASGYGIPDVGLDAFDRRTRAGSYASGVFGPADLVRANRLSLDLLLDQYRQHSAEDGDCLLIDGRRATYQPLRTYTSVDVQLVEAFRANAFVDPFIVSEMQALRECRGTLDRHPSYFVLWTRGLR